ncbi:hypothetical protein SAMN02745866_01893 [Alteromonadaceae bacterium Bs31]|nr:hypothetical protein SAMN02745866_01893 [Alteromonadaceae bacterium Bs31]
MDKKNMATKVVFINGGTGFIGRALCSALLKDRSTIFSGERHCDGANLLKDEPDFALYVQTRMPSHHRHRFINFVSSYSALPENIVPDIVINLAGAPIADKRWTAQRKKVLLDSRIRLTENLYRSVKVKGHSPVLISASAIGFYGVRGDEALSEHSEKGQGFASELCSGWEDAALQFTDLGSRVCIFRIGVVLGAKGGALRKMVPLFKLGLGGPIATGMQWMSWIHICDLVRLITTAISNENYSGVFNATAPEPVRQKEFADQLANTLGRKALLPTPGFMLRLVFGQMAEELLIGGQRVLPEKVLAQDFSYCHSSVASALKDIDFS